MALETDEVNENQGEWLNRRHKSMSNGEINNYRDAINQVRALRLFYSHVFIFICVISVLFLINLLSYSGFFWVFIPLVIWGSLVVIHGMHIFWPN